MCDSVILCFGGKNTVSLLLFPEEQELYMPVALCLTEIPYAPVHFEAKIECRRVGCLKVRIFRSAVFRSCIGIIIILHDTG